MSEPINNGGPAFPSTPEQDAQGFGGMTLRDYFAAKAMGAIIGPLWSDPESRIQMRNQDSNDVAMIIGRAAHQLADAMLKAREAQR